ncbi:amidase [Prosthecomicrobium hirschii]|uniref:Amidase n=1 Tax=Prosthecodimorpha hirschii TaxID=665126 RepID=A0A0P6W8D2_9HYPH|nr:amidase [Prosthecomicrobium hirschii]KPL54861.1 amidase [Prosthecomicrobium hirschii]
MSGSRFPAPVSAVAVAAAVEAGRTTAAAAIERSIAAVEAHDEMLSAFVTTGFDEARAAAATSGPLAGLALGVKDIIDTAGLATEMGSPLYAGNRPRADAPVVALARRAGAAVIGKTVTTEFAYLQPGPTRNPARLDHTPGGSSSGSAAAVAAGLIPLAFGTQTGGSVVRPAAFCGVAGFKPSFRLIPTVGVKCFSWSLDTVGVFGAGVADAAYFMAALTGRDLRVDGRDPAAPRIGLVRTHLWEEASGEMRQAVETAGRLAEAGGARLVDIELPGLFADAFAAHQVIQDFQAAQALAWEYDHHAQALSPILRDALALGRMLKPEDYDRARRTARQARLALRDLFADIDVILTPSAPGAAPEGLATTGTSIFNRLWTLMGTPALNVPGLTGAGGLPLGVQIVAPFGRDRACLEAGRFLERQLSAT